MRQLARFYQHNTDTLSEGASINTRRGDVYHEAGEYYLSEHDTEVKNHGGWQSETTELFNNNQYRESLGSGRFNAKTADAIVQTLIETRYKEWHHAK